MNILERQYQFYLYNGFNELVYKTNDFNDAVKYKNSHDDISIFTYRR